MSVIPAVIQGPLHKTPESMVRYALLAANGLMGGAALSVVGVSSIQVSDGIAVSMFGQ
ncbi:hypothetical protein EJ05DRAFT_504106 [Pseudovirgaria hyperparasitica]|uniref:Uncharacterized protein n=1 Tax=Pseudovirgaria hyperparasitica TaxID=470096 RepID=A0A6A6VVH5_9PEZI|nr:uncharacterized protein EJ05DRAFT_504106 [Pseudovirgaria hyperparasitica]KAF2754572.1 hypothetical protein EJ05DRAFT_504106 [Pseudovirgaria hyperparasitica]